MTKAELIAKAFIDFEAAEGNLMDALSGVTKRDIERGLKGRDTAAFNCISTSVKKFLNGQHGFTFSAQNLFKSLPEDLQREVKTPGKLASAIRAMKKLKMIEQVKDGVWRVV